MTNSRRKGADGERELANMLTRYGFDAIRGQQHKGTPDSPDVICQRLEAIGFIAECKRVQALNIHKAYSKASKDAGDNKDAVVFHRKNGEEWLATISLEDFLFLAIDREFWIMKMKTESFVQYNQAGLMSDYSPKENKDETWK